MNIKHYLYNAFLIEDEGEKIAIDPGQNLYLFQLRSLIPKNEWQTITHVLVTHGDPDHYFQADRVALAANSPLIMNDSMIKHDSSEMKILTPRSDTLQFVPYSGKLSTISVGETIEVDGIKIKGIRAQHGPIKYKIFGFKKHRIPGPNERTGFGAIGFYIHLNGKTIMNVGDSLLQEEWSGLKPDVLMLPIGGFGNNVWTMDVADAVAAVRIIEPKNVIPCHYNVPFILNKKFAPADDQQFKHEVEKMGITCHIMHSEDMLEIN